MATFSERYSFSSLVDFISQLCVPLPNTFVTCNSMNSYRGNCQHDNTKLIYMREEITSRTPFVFPSISAKVSLSMLCTTCIAQQYNPSVWNYISFRKISKQSVLGKNQNSTSLLHELFVLQMCS